jgi:hypothetical protein
VGTRADFYSGRGENAEWLGSIGWDGYPDGIDDEIKNAKSDAEFREAVEAFLMREDAIRPREGWPWPWDDSNTTDYSYAFDGEVWGTCFGHGWWPVNKESEESRDAGKVAFPDMKARKNVQFGAKSGAIIISAK